MALAKGLALLRAAAGGLRGPGRPICGGVDDVIATPDDVTGAGPSPSVPLPHARAWSGAARTPSGPAAPRRRPPPAPPSPYRDRPWEYLESEEYRLAYGSRPVWLGYRRNHKGSVPPQRTRKACLRRGKPVGNPCPICRDRHLRVHFRNVKLLDQFVCPHTGAVLHPTHTGVCMKQHKLLTEAIARAQDHGLLWVRVPYVPAPRGDFSNRHAAVSETPPAPGLAPGRRWYPWYAADSPAASVARARRLCEGFPKGGDPPAGTPPPQPLRGNARGE
ncbi:LOW QUALITY PROTEIN: small ribosomal subunit protein mS40 [Rhynochetos jubatus]